MVMKILITSSFSVGIPSLIFGGWRSIRIRLFELLNLPARNTYLGT